MISFNFFYPAYAVQHVSKYLYLLSPNPLIFCKAKTPNNQKNTQQVRINLKGKQLFVFIVTERNRITLQRNW